MPFVAVFTKFAIFWAFAAAPLNVTVPIGRFVNPSFSKAATAI